MAVLSLNTNLSSLQTQRRIADTTSALSKSFERLSSGLRVSRAADDAAGLALASGLSVDSRVFAQGLRNLSDGAGVTNIAEGALDELTNIVLRLQELAEQAANGTLGQTQRNALDAEAQALSKEYFRIAKTTEFNGRKLFDGSMQGLSLQAGYGSSGALLAALGGRLGTGSFQAEAQFTAGPSPGTVATGDLNSDGLADVVSMNGNATASVFLGNGDGSFRTAAQLSITGGAAEGLALGDLNSDGVLDIVTGSGINASAVFLGNGDGTFKRKTDVIVGAAVTAVTLGDLNADGAVDVVGAVYGEGDLVVLLGNGDGTFGPKSNLAPAGIPRSAALGDLNGDGSLDIVSPDRDLLSVSVLFGNGDGTFEGPKVLETGPSPYFAAVADLNDDGALDILSANSADDSMSVLLGNGDGTFRPPADYITGDAPFSLALGDLNGDGCLDAVSGNNSASTASVLLGNGDGSFKSKLDLAGGSSGRSTALADLNQDGVLDLVSSTANAGAVSARLAHTQDGVSPLLVFSLRTQTDAKWALELMKQKLVQLAAQRGTIGANQSRLTTAVANLHVACENYSCAGSRITDVDVASESSQLLKTQILQQAASAVLAQANQAPALALDLLSDRSSY